MGHTSLFMFEFNSYQGCYVCRGVIYVLSVHQLLFYELSFNYLRSIIISFLWLLPILILNIIGDLWYLTQWKYTLGQRPTKSSRVSIFLWNITDNAFHVTGIISQNMGRVRHIILIVSVMSRLICLSDLRFGKFVSFKIWLSELAIRYSRIYKSSVSKE